MHVSFLPFRCDRGEWATFFFGMFESYRFRSILHGSACFQLWMYKLLLYEWNLLENKVPPNLYTIKINNKKKELNRSTFFFFFIYSIERVRNAVEDVWNWMWKTSCWYWFFKMNANMALFNRFKVHDIQASKSSTTFTTRTQRNGTFDAQNSQY